MGAKIALFIVGIAGGKLKNIKEYVREIIEKYE